MQYYVGGRVHLPASQIVTVEIEPSNYNMSTLTSTTPRACVSTKLR